MDVRDETVSVRTWYGSVYQVGRARTPVLHATPAEVMRAMRDHVAGGDWDVLLELATLGNQVLRVRDSLASQGVGVSQLLELRVLQMRPAE